MARVAVKVHPRARRSALAGRFGEAYKLDLAAPPVNGRANDECISFFARLAGVHAVERGLHRRAGRDDLVVAGTRRAPSRR